MSILSQLYDLNIYHSHIYTCMLKEEIMRKLKGNNKAIIYYIFLSVHPRVAQLMIPVMSILVPKMASNVGRVRYLVVNLMLCGLNVFPGGKQTGFHITEALNNSCSLC